MLSGVGILTIFVLYVVYEILRSLSIFPTSDSFDSDALERYDQIDDDEQDMIDYTLRAGTFRNRL